MNIEYLKSQFIPKNKKLQVIYTILWILEPALMASIITYKVVRNRNK